MQFERGQTGKSGARFLAMYNLSALLLILITIFAIIYQALGLIDGDAIVTRPLDFLYFSFVTWTTLGYGDLKPSLDSRMFAASEAFLGYLFMGLYIAVIFHWMSARADNNNATSTNPITASPATTPSP